jgi:hypothetical protein
MSYGKYFDYSSYVTMYLDTHTSLRHVVLGIRPVVLITQEAFTVSVLSIEYLSNSSVFCHWPNPQVDNRCVYETRRFCFLPDRPQTIHASVMHPKEGIVHGI